MVQNSDPLPIPTSGPDIGAEYDRLREAGRATPVRLPDGSDAWLVTGHGAVARALADPHLSLDRRYAKGGWTGFSLPPALDANLLNMDPPDHTRIRRLVSSAFTPQRVAALRPGIRRIADELLDALPSTGEVDLVEGYAAPLSVRVIGELLGVPSADQADFRAWTSAMLTTHTPDRQAVGQAIVQLHGYLIGLLQAKRQQSGDDLLSDLVTVGDGVNRISRDELTSLAFLILMAGYENAANLISNTVVRLLSREGGLTTLAIDPEPPAPPRVNGAQIDNALVDAARVDLARVDSALVEAVIEESLCQEPPAPVAIRRFPVEDMVIDGTPIPAGATVLLSLTAANREPGATANLAFGRGIHYCVGAALAQAETTEAILALAERFPTLALAKPAEQLSWRTSFRTHGPAELLVTW